MVRWRICFVGGPKCCHLSPGVTGINIQTEIVNGERGHYLVWSVRVNVGMIRVSKLLGSNSNPNPNFTLTLIITLNSS